MEACSSALRGIDTRVSAWRCKNARDGMWKIKVARGCARCCGKFSKSAWRHFAVGENVQ